MAGKRILTTRAVVNMVVSDDVYTSDDRLVIPEGTILTEDIIQALKEYSIFAIRIQVEKDGTTPKMGFEEDDDEEQDDQQESEEIEKKNSTDQLAPKESQTPKESQAPKAQQEPKQRTFHNASLRGEINLDLYYDAVRKTPEYHEFNKAFFNSVERMKDAFNRVVMKNEELDSESILKDVENVVAKSRNPLHILDMLQCMRGYDDVTYIHSMNVALLSNMIGRIVYPNMDKKELEVLTMSGLLHDIGKIMISDDIIKKKDRLTISEYNLVKTHVLHGNNILKSQNLDERIAEVAMRHHERCDGSGYPGGYKGNQISTFAKIVAIADTYDAMTSDRVYRKAICPFDVIHMFEREGLTKFDVEFLLPFLETAVQSYMNTDVCLTTDEIGKVVMVNENELSKPVVKVGDIYYDLTKEKTISIDRIID